MADDPKYVEDENTDGLPLDHAQQMADEAEGRRRFGDLNDHARDIMVHLYGVPTNHQIELAYQRLKEAVPAVMSAQTGNTRRYQWTQRQAEQGGLKPYDKKRPTNHDLGADPSSPVVKYHADQMVTKSDGDQIETVWDYLFYRGKGSTVPTLYTHDGQIITRDMLRAMKPYMEALADDLGITGSLQFRSQDQDGRPADLDKPIEELTDMKRLVLMFARAFCPRFEPEDFTR